jgi:hypothetical protein
MCIRTKQAHAAVVELAKACDLKDGQIFLEPSDLRVMLAVIAQQYKASICAEAFEDEFIDKVYTSILYAEDCIQDAYDVAKDIAEDALIDKAINFFHGNVRRAMEA